MLAWAGWRCEGCVLLRWAEAVQAPPHVPGWLSTGHPMDHSCHLVISSFTLTIHLSPLWLFRAKWMKQPSIIFSELEGLGTCPVWLSHCSDGETEGKDNPKLTPYTGLEPSPLDCIQRVWSRRKFKGNKSQISKISIGFPEGFPASSCVNVLWADQEPHSDTVQRTCRHGQAWRRRRVGWGLNS